MRAYLYSWLKPSIKYCGIAVISSMLLSCNYDTRSSGRSGTYQDDYLENPINEDFVQYAPALKTSNTLIELMQSGKANIIADQYVLDELKPLLTAADIQDLIDKSTAEYGAIVHYKPMQWGFEPKTENGKRDKSEFNRLLAEKYGDKKAGNKIPILFSVKIVEHERGMVNYWFQFPADGKYQKILGIYYKERKGTRNVGQF